MHVVMIKNYTVFEQVNLNGYSVMQINTFKLNFH